MSEQQHTVKILATADVHFGGPIGGGQSEQVYRSPTESWRLIVRNCIDQKADVLLIAGDLIDQDADFARVNEELGSSFEALGKKGIDIVLISGNHDYDLLPFFLGTQSFDHVTLLGADGNWESIIVEKKGIRFGIAGRSFPEISQQTAPLSGAEEILDSALHPLIAMLHCDTKHPESIYGYVDVDRLIELPVDAWVLGHLHESYILKNRPIIIYPGRPGLETNQLKVNDILLTYIYSYGNKGSEPFSIHHD